MKSSLLHMAITALAVIMAACGNNQSPESIEIYESNGKYGLKDNSSGKIITDAEFDFISNFSEGLAAACIGGKWGLCRYFRQNNHTIHL